MARPSVVLPPLTDRGRTAVDGADGRRRVARQSFDRRRLERQGWRTTLEYRETHRREPDGRLAHVVAEWCAECERIDEAGDVLVAEASGPNVAAAWSRLRRSVDRIERSRGPSDRMSAGSVSVERR